MTKFVIFQASVKYSRINDDSDFEYIHCKSMPTISDSYSFIVTSQCFGYIMPYKNGNICNEVTISSHYEISLLAF